MHSQMSADTSSSQISSPDPKATAPSPPPSAFVRYARKIYHPLGFKKGYNFTLFFIFCGALVGFCLARLQYLDFDRVLCGSGYSAVNRALPGECFWYRNSRHEHIGIILHLAAILPAGLLVWLQFIPAIRYKSILFHRINGYLVVLLSLLGTIGGLMVTRHAFGGSLATQTATGAIGLSFVVSMVLAWVNIKRLQIEQHRAWMIRGWVYAGAIISLRPISMIAAQIISRIGGYYTPMPCKVVAFLVENPKRFVSLFPACAAFASGQEPEAWTLVTAKFSADVSSAAQPAAAFHLAFAMGSWLALLIHAVGVELYLHLTPVEAERLRKVSYQRQLEAGMRHPGNAGLTATRLGDTGHNMEVQGVAGTNNIQKQ